MREVGYIGYIFTSGAFVTPVLQTDGMYRWVVTSFEDDTFEDGVEILPVEVSRDVDGLFKEME